MTWLFDDLQSLATEYAEANDTDFAIYFGQMKRPYDDNLIDACRKRRRRGNILLMLTTNGGDTSVAYRIGRAFQKFYGTGARTSEGKGPEFTVFIPSICKSAGTILAAGATKLIMSDFAELGPIEVQLRSPSEVGERTSSLAPVQALDSLQRQSKSLFRQHFSQMRFDESLTFSTKMAAEIATQLTVGLLNPIYAQVDPIRLAEVERSLKISGDYTERLTAVREASNLKEDTIEKLLGGYPSHGFVIDKMEAEKLFERVEEPDEKLARLVDREFRLLSRFPLDTDKDPWAFFLSSEPGDKDDEQSDGESAEGAGEGESEIREADDTENNDTASQPEAAAAAYPERS